MCICLLNHKVCLRIWFLLISANWLPVFFIHILNGLLPNDQAKRWMPFICTLTEWGKTLWWKNVKHWLHENFKVVYFFFFLLLSSLFCSLALWLWCVWAWTSFSSSSTPSGFAVEDANVTSPHTPIHTPSNPVPTAVALLGVSSLPRSFAGKRRWEKIVCSWKKVFFFRVTFNHHLALQTCHQL